MRSYTLCVREWYERKPEMVEDSREFSSVLFIGENGCVIGTEVCDHRESSKLKSDLEKKTCKLTIYSETDQCGNA